MAVPFRKETISFDEKSLELSIPEGEQRRVPVREILLSVEFVKVMHHHRKDCFYIYGEISFSDTESGHFVTLFKRSRDDPDIMNLGNPVFQFLILSDNDLPSFRPLQGGSPIFVRMELYEIVYDDDEMDDGEDQKPTETEQETSDDDGIAQPTKLVGEEDSPNSERKPEIKVVEEDSRKLEIKVVEEDSPNSERKPEIKVVEEDSNMTEGKQLQETKIDDAGVEDQSRDSQKLKLKEKDQDILIADITHTYDDFYGVNKRSYFTFDGPEETGFFFKVAYANVAGSIPAEVTFTINSEPYLPSKEEGPGSSVGKRKLPPTAIHGIIAAHQSLGDSTRNPRSVQLYYKSESEPGNVSVGSPLHLDRRYVVVPIAFGNFWIGYSLDCAENHNEIAAGAVPFFIPTDDNLFFVTDKNLCHKRKSQDGLVSVSLKFITSVEADPSEPLSINLKRIPELGPKTLP